MDGWSISSAWLDYDRDGCVDLFIGRYVKFDPKYRNYYAADNYPGPLDYEADTNRLYRNNCNGSFTDLTDKSGLGAFKGRTMGVTAADYDGDGYSDIYVANDKTENFLFHNKHDGTFEEIAGDLGVAYGQNGEMTSAMGPIFADVENSGRLDLWVSDSKYNRLLRNTPRNGFEDITAETGISALSAQYVSWGSGIFDFALSKAQASAAWGFSTAQMLESARGTPGFERAPHVVIVAGGLPVFSADGRTRVGAVGVSGEAPADDAACAEAGVKAAGLRTSRS